MKRHAALALAGLTALAACGSDHRDQAAANPAPPPSTGPVKISSNNAFSPLVQDLNKAKAVNGQVQEQAKKADQSLENDTAPAASTIQP